MSQLFVGVGREVITPKVGASLVGYAPRPALSIHDDLHITVFAFEYEGEQAMLASADLCNLRREAIESTLAAFSEASGLPKERLIIACTHTHSGPSGHDVEYMTGVFLPALKKAAQAALASLKPAEIGVGTVHSDVAINRRQIKENGKVALGQNPFGSYDPDMTVVAFREPDGTPIGNFIHYGCHNTGCGRNDAVSRDWCGVAIDQLEKQSGGITCFINGCGGDCG